MSKAIPLARSLQHLTAGTLHEITSLPNAKRIYSYRACHFAISMILDPRMKILAFSNREAAQQAEQWISHKVKAFIPVELTIQMPEDK